MQTEIPRINLVNRSSIAFGLSPTDLLHVLKEYVNRHVGPIWDVEADLRLGEPGAGWELWLIDDADQPDVLGYHDLEADGMPRCFVSVRECLRYGEPVSVVASHELAEMLVNPTMNLGAFSPRGRWLALEVCDPIGSHTFEIAGGVPVADFCYPAWFGLPGGPLCDHMGECRMPYEVLASGYIPYFQNGQWDNLFGSPVAKRAYSEEDRRLHRTERLSQRSRRQGTLDMVAYLAAGGTGAYA